MLIPVHSRLIPRLSLRPVTKRQFGLFIQIQRQGPGKAVLEYGFADSDSVHSQTAFLGVGEETGRVKIEPERRGRVVMEKVIIKNPRILGGEPVFRGTRVPFKILTDYLEGGDSLDEFLEQYPSVTREAAVAAIEEARLSLVAQL